MLLENILHRCLKRAERRLSVGGISAGGRTRRL